MSKLIVGKTDSTAWSALEFMQRYHIPAEAYAEAVAMPVDEEACARKNFYPNKTRAPFVECTAEDAGELFAYLQRNDFSAYNFSAAQRVMARATSLMAGPAQARLASISEEIDEIRSGTYNIWKPPSVDADFWGPPPPGFK